MILEGKAFIIQVKHNKKLISSTFFSITTTNVYISHHVQLEIILRNTLSHTKQFGWQLNIQKK